MYTYLSYSDNVTYFLGMVAIYVYFLICADNNYPVCPILFKFKAKLHINIVHIHDINDRSIA